MMSTWVSREKIATIDGVICSALRTEPQKTWEFIFNYQSITSHTGTYVRYLIYEGLYVSRKGLNES